MFGHSTHAGPYGLFYYTGHRATAVPLVKVDAKATVVDLSASVLLTQVYRNDQTETIEANYVFPVPARAAVNAFAFVKEDGTRVVGVVEEKEEAKQQYDEAVESGKLASLMEQATPDTFKCSVGNILPNETVTIEISYVTELTEGDTSDSIRFHLPSRVGCRYGPPNTLFGSENVGPMPPSPFTVHVNVETASPISKISCLSHTISTELGPDPSLPNAASLPFANYARLAFTSEASLERDFVLELASPELDSPRCLAERHPSSDSVAVSLTFVPRFKLPEVENQEFVFLVDRSGSMGGDRITMAKKALVVLLRSLPHKGTTFNIVSFGSGHEALWETGSRAYNQSTLDEATKLVDSMDANFGGTEMRNALDSVFNTRKKDRSTSVFVLTDGDAWDLDGVYGSVKKAISTSTDASPLRVFVLGIGNSASTAMCEGIARHGRGLAQFVVDGESFTGKCNRLLKAAKSPMILNARLDYGVKEEKKGDEDEDFEVIEPEKEGVVKKTVEKVTEAVKSISLFDKNVNPLAADESKPAPEPEPVSLAPPPPVQQAPRKIHNLYPGSRLRAYAIISSASLLPSTITLRGELASGQKLELDIPVTTSKLPPASSSASTSSSTPAPPPIHTLTARKLIQSLEDGDHDLRSSLPTRSDDDDLLTRTVKAHIVRLGKTYSLVSTHTSFVAIDESELRKPRKRIETLAPAPPTLFGSAPMSASIRARSRAGPPGGGAALYSMQAVPPPPPAPMPMSAPVAAFGAPPQAPMAAACFAPPGAPPPPSGGLFGSSAPAQAASGGGLFGGGGSFLARAAPVSLLGSAPKAKKAAVGGGLFGSAPPAAADAASSPPDPATLSSSDRIDALARLQSFDGSFSPSALALCNTSTPAAELVKKLPADLQGVDGVEKVVATLVVLAFWEREMRKEREEWEEMAAKGREFVAAAVGKSEDEVEELVKLF